MLMLPLLVFMCKYHLPIFDFPKLCFPPKFAKLLCATSSPAGLLLLLHRLVWMVTVVEEVVAAVAVVGEAKKAAN